MTVKYQKIKNINIDKFGSDVRNYYTDLDQERSSLEQLLTNYNETLLGTLNKHAPLHEEKCRITHRQPWFNNRIKQELVLGRRLECKWLNDQTEYNFQAFYYQRQHISNVIKTVKKQYYIRKLHENRDVFKRIFGITNKLLLRGQSLPLPTADNLQQLANDFSDFFKM